MEIDEFLTQTSLEEMEMWTSLSEFDDELLLTAYKTGNKKLIEKCLNNLMDSEMQKSMIELY